MIVVKKFLLLLTLFTYLQLSAHIYNTVKIEIPNASDVMVYDINNNGVIVGTARINDTDRVFTWTAGEGPTLLDIPFFSTKRVVPQFINNRNQIVGTYWMEDNELDRFYLFRSYESRRFLWDPETGLHDLGKYIMDLIEGFTDLGEVLITDHTHTYITGIGISTEEIPIQGDQFFYHGGTHYPISINNQNQVAYSSTNPNSRIVLYSRDSKTHTLIGNLGSSALLVVNLNDAGDIVGTEKVTNDYSRGFIYTSEKGKESFENFYPRSINNFKEAVGFRIPDGQRKDGRRGWWKNGELRYLLENFNFRSQHVGALWKNGQLIDLVDLIDPSAIDPSLQVFPLKINDQGQIIVITYDAKTKKISSLTLVPNKPQ